MGVLAIKIGGTLSILLGIGHCYFYRGFRWGKDLQKISVLNAKVLYTIHIFLIPLFLLFGYLSWVYPNELAGGSSLGITLTLFYSLFWLARGSWQVVYFNPSKLNGVGRLVHLHYFLVIYFFSMWIAYTVPIISHFL